MKDQIEEMAEYIFGNGITHDTAFHEDCRSIARDLYNAGYRKQSEGEWNMKTYPVAQCSVCGLRRNIETQDSWRFCPQCGAKMKGEQQ